MHVLHPAPLGALPLEGKYPKPQVLNPTRRLMFRALGGHPWSLFSFVSFHFGLLCLHFLSFWPFGPSFPFILAFWAFISFHFRLLSFHFLSFWPFGPSFPFILAFWAFVSFHFGLLGLHFLSFLACLGCHVGSSPQVAKNGPFPNEI